MATFGYARVSATDQDFNGQIDRLKAAGADRIYAEKVSGKSTNGRHELGKALKACIDTPVPMLQRVVLMVWFASVAVAPRALARQLIALRFMPSIRPPWFDRLFINFKTGGWRGSPRSHATKHGRAENRPRGWI